MFMKSSARELASSFRSGLYLEADLTLASNEHETSTAFPHLLRILNTCHPDFSSHRRRGRRKADSPRYALDNLSAHTIALYRLCPDNISALPNRTRYYSSLREKLQYKTHKPSPQRNSTEKAYLLDDKVRHCSRFSIESCRWQMHKHWSFIQRSRTGFQISTTIQSSCCMQDA